MARRLRFAIASIFVLTLLGEALGIQVASAQVSRGAPNFILILTDDKCEVTVQFRGGILKTL